MTKRPKSFAVSRCCLIFGYLLFFWVPFEATVTPVLTTAVVETFGPEGLDHNCENSYVRRECRYIAYTSALEKS
ncbi:MAG: hypothetical protein M5R36_17890 [Deltaproteobacteria bacterium]|nr:hypothetical protein [Deltaproteobacteria bacterium]